MAGIQQRFENSCGYQQAAGNQLLVPCMPVRMWLKGSRRMLACFQAANVAPVCIAVQCPLDVKGAVVAHTYKAHPWLQRAEH